MTILCKSKNLT